MSTSSSEWAARMTDSALASALERTLEAPDFYEEGQKDAIVWESVRRLREYRRPRHR